MAAENILGGSVTEVLKRLSFLIIEEIKLARGFKNDLKKLQNTVNMMLAVIADAEKRPVKEEVVRLRLKRLKDLAYEADDILDVFSYERMRRGDQLKCKRDQVRNFVSLKYNPLIFSLKMANKIKDINRKFDELGKQTKTVDLLAINLSLSNIMIVDDVISRENKETYSHIGDRSKIVGRENDKKKILEMIMNTDGSNTDRISVIPIVGMGGLGKTTLAQLVYDADLVKEQFEPRIWVCVSDVFDLKKILRDLIQQQSTCDDASSKEVMITKLHEKLRGKKYFLVLDDMWNEKHEDWMKLKEILGVGDKRSIILVTTRSNKVASIVKGNLPPYELPKLSDEECWSVFEHSAGEIVNQNLVDIGREMVKRKCNGLPLAAMILGGVMHSREEHEWKSITKNEISDTLLKDQNSIFPILKLSYDRLPLPLKECFSYCAIFPKDFKFKRKILIQQWSAEGFLDPQRNNKAAAMEDIGNEYFHSLLRNSLFQDAEKDEFGNIVSCKMHGLLHDLAQTISGNNNALTNNSETSVIKTGGGESFRVWLDIDDNNNSIGVLEALNSKRKLRTCLVGGIGRVDQSIVVDNVIGAAKCLRVLDLSWIGVEKLQPSVGNLKHLRYLDLTGNWRLRDLPGSIIQLYNLETLILYRCNLEVLPDDIGSLKNLRYLDLSWNIDIIMLPDSITGLTNLQTLILRRCGKLAFHSGIGSLKKLRNLDLSEIRMKVLPESVTALTDLQTLNFGGWIEEVRMPKGLGGLSNLQTLRKFKVPTEEEKRVDMVAGIEELEHLNLLRGKLQIYNLERVKDKTDAQSANLKWKSNIDEVILEWAWEHTRSDGFDKDEVVLEGLQPHPNLKRLEIKRFMGEKLPTWMNSCILRFLPNLVEIELWYLRRCEQLSGLGQLPSLKQLTLYEMNLERWEEAPPASTTNEKSSLFPCLDKLTIFGCRNLRITPTLFPSLKHLNVSYTNVMAVSSLVSNHLISLTSLRINRISELKFLSRDLLQHKLHSLEITYCSKFQGFVQQQNEDEMSSFFFDASYLRERLTSLTKLIIHYEKEPQWCFPVALGCLTSLEELEIRCFYVPSSSSSSSREEQGYIIQQQQQQQQEQQNCFRSLRKLVIDGCYSLAPLPQQIQYYFTKLQELVIRNMVDMVALPDWVGNLSLLRKLEISGCLKLTHLQSEQVMQRLTSLEELYINGVVSETANKFPVEGIQHLVSLRKLDIFGNYNLNITCLPEQIQHLTSLDWLYLKGFNGLVELPEWLRNFSSLWCLWIQDCENLKYLPSEEAMKHLTKLSSLCIYGCPLLVKRCEKETGEEWHKISHIKKIFTPKKNVFFSSEEYTAIAATREAGGPTN